MNQTTKVRTGTILLAATLALAGCGEELAPEQLAGTETIFLEFLDAANAVGAIDSGLYAEYEGRDLAAWQTLEQKHRAALTASLAAIDE